MQEAGASYICASKYISSCGLAGVHRPAKLLRCRWLKGGHAACAAFAASESSTSPPLSACWNRRTRLLMAWWIFRESSPPPPKRAGHLGQLGALLLIICEIVLLQPHIQQCHDLIGLIMRYARELLALDCLHHRYHISFGNVEWHWLLWTWKGYNSYITE